MMLALMSALDTVKSVGASIKAIPQNFPNLSIQNVKGQTNNAL